MKDGVRGLVQSLARKRSGKGVEGGGCGSNVGSSKTAREFSICSSPPTGHIRHRSYSSAPLVRVFHIFFLNLQNPPCFPARDWVKGLFGNSTLRSH